MKPSIWEIIEILLIGVSVYFLTLAVQLYFLG